MTFERIVHTGDNRRYSASFTQVHAPTGKFFVELYDAEGNKANFEMIRDERMGWRIARPAPDWVFPLEAKLVEHINGRTAP
jgi:hypothetical protein